MNFQQNQDSIIQSMAKAIQKLMTIIVIQLILLIAAPFLILNRKEIVAIFKDKPKVVSKKYVEEAKKVEYWNAPDVSTIVDSVQKKQIEYGRELIAHTAIYLGPNGSVKKISNGMNCQNCHLDAGTRVFGNNYGSVASLYPKFRNRSGAIENIYKRINDCLERSLNGKAIDTLSQEMQAMQAYLNYLGSNVSKGVKAQGSGFKDLGFLNRAADPVKGKEIYISKCLSCHMANGEGQISSTKVEYKYPPLWGQHSYNDGAGLYRISNFAKYVKYNMPWGVHYDNPQLSDDEAWDVAAFVNSQPRPHKIVPLDWPDIKTKPVDHPYGPYVDSYNEKQHKYGPFKPIQEEIEQIQKTSKKI
jgi:thiosulfate dehydrogenase